eukprot:m.30933 g.30933  ORF g.30933 m.30933 type:complete len:380 (-) comp8259_c0_seq1:3185-4324(-)
MTPPHHWKICSCALQAGEARISRAHAKVSRRSLYSPPWQPDNTFNKIKSVLIVSKVSRFEYEKKKLDTESDYVLEQTLQKRGSCMERLKARYMIHKKNLNDVEEEFRSRGIRVTTVRADKFRTNYTHPNDLVEADAIFSAGGDGTFIDAAALAFGKKPVIGINTDSEKSRGELCLKLKPGETAQQSLQKFLDGHFKWLRRTRIRLTFVDADNTSSTVPYRTLNEVFVAENSPHKTSTYVFKMDSIPPEVHKNSGLIISTGTGSTAWIQNEIRIPDVVIRELFTHGKLASIDKDDVQEAVDEYRRTCVFPSTEDRMLFFCRSSITGKHISGYARRVELESRSFNASITLDSAKSFDFNDGRRGVLSIHNEDKLLTAELTR